MKKLLISEPFKTKIIDAKEPQLINKDSSIVKPLFIGICGSDLEVFVGKYGGITYPVAPGHEFMGQVDKITKNAVGIKKGDIVVVNPNISCGKCFYCKKEKKYLCSSLEVLGGESMDGAMQEKIEVPIKNLIKISNITEYSRLALTEPMSVSLHSIKLTELGHKVLIFGLGCIGTLSYLYLRDKYNKDISVIEASEERIKEFESKNIGNIYNYKNVVNDSVSLEEKFDSILIECPYDQKIINLCIKLIRKGGKIIVVGRPKEKICFDFIELLFKEISIFNSFKNTEEDFKEASHFLSEFDVTKDVELKVFNLIDAQKAFNFKIKNPKYKVLIKN